MKKICTVSDFMMLEKPEEYDVKKQTGNELYGKVNNALERYILYKSTTCKGSVYPQMDLHIKEKAIMFGLTDIDCDTAPLIKQIYHQLWKDAILHKTSSMIDGEHGETMTSMQTMLNELVKQVEPPKSGKVSKRYCTYLYFSNPNSIANLEASSSIGAFAEKLHTIGNFLPVPPGFNVARAHHDYWDLTMVKLKQWYLEPQSEKQAAILEQLLNSDKAVIENCWNWLSWCGKGKHGLDGWRSFLEVNWLQDFVYGDEAEPIMFCGHSWDRRTNKDDLDEIFTKCSKLIHKRSIRMVKALKGE